jgi:hypothetical protein
MRVSSAAPSTFFACSSVSAFDGRPGRPVGISQSSTTFRLTLSRAMARRTDRLRIECSLLRVLVLSCRARPASQRSTSSAVRSRSRRAPSSGTMCFSASRRFVAEVDSPAVLP